MEPASQAAVWVRWPRHRSAVGREPPRRVACGLIGKGASDFTVSGILGCPRFAGDEREHQPELRGGKLGLGLLQFRA